MVVNPSKPHPPKLLEAQESLQTRGGITLLDNPQAIRECLDRITSPGVVVGLDTETVGVDPGEESPVGRGTAVCFSLAITDPALGTHPTTGTPLARRYFAWADVLPEFRSWLENPQYLKVGDAIYSYDKHILANMGFELQGISCDNLRLSRLCNPDKKTHGLKEFLESTLGYSVTSYKETFKRRHCLGEEDFGDTRLRKRTVESRQLNAVVGGPSSRLGAGWEVMDVATFARDYPDRLDRVYDYASLDAKGSLERYFYLRKSAESAEWRGLGKAKPYGNLWEFYERIWHKFLQVLWEIERVGIRYQPSAVSAGRTAAEIETRRLLDELHYWAGPREGEAGSPGGPEEPFNPASAPQLTRELYERRNLPVPPVEGNRTALKKVKPGKRPTSEASLLWLQANGHDPDKGITKLLEWRKESRQLQFMEALPTHVLQSTGRIHSILQPEAATGRLTSKKPNLQQIPKRYDPHGIRSAFLPEPGNVFIVADYSQLEMVILSHFLIDLFGDHTLAQDLATGDAHAATAARLGLPREVAKEINYGISYGKSEMGLGLSLGIPKKQAAAYLKKYFHVYPGIPRFQAYCLEQAKRTGVVRTLGGRLRAIPGARSEVNHVLGSAARKASNTPIQGSAADIVVAAMLRLHERLAATGLGQMVLQVHDELLVEVPECQAEEALALVKHTMEHPFSRNVLRVPLTVSAKAATSWLAGK